MKDWKSDLLAIKIATPQKKETKTSDGLVEIEISTIQAALVKPIEIERKMASVLHKLGRDDEAEEIERRVAAVAEIVEED